MADLRNDLAKAFEAELSKLPDGARNNIQDAMSRNESLSFVMFVAGWEARERTEQQRAPSKSQAKRIAAQKGEKP